MPFDIDDPETKAAVATLVDAAVGKANTKAEETATALQTSNAKLMAQLRDAKKGQEIDPVKHAALEDKVAELEGKLTTAVKDTVKMTKEHGTQLDHLNKQLSAENGFTQRLLVDNGLSDALVKAGVAPNFLPAVKAMLSGQVKIVADGEMRKAQVGDKPLSEYVTAWAQSDEGKHFVSAPTNSGGGAAGSNANNNQGNATTYIQAGDKAAFGANLAELAKGSKGTVQVAAYGVA